jgi:uncharacterized protein
MMLFDAHTHWNPLDGSGPEAGAADWLATWARFGISHGVVMPLAGLMSDSQIQSDNDRVAAVCACSKGRMIPFCTVSPTLGGEALAEFRRCVEVLKCRGLKLHPWLQGISASSSEVDELCELAGDFGVPVMFHDGTPCFSLPSQIALLARRHPRTTMILGHCGIFEHWREAIAAMNHAENLWGCLCSPHVAALREIVARSDADRLLWGSDFGFGTADHIEYRLKLVDLLDLSDNQRDAIFSRNPARLFPWLGCQIPK